MSRVQRMIDAGQLAVAMGAVALLFSDRWHEGFSVASAALITHYMKSAPAAPQIAAPDPAPPVQDDDEAALALGRQVLSMCRRVYTNMVMVGTMDDGQGLTCAQRAWVRIGDRPKLSITVTGETGKTP